MKKTIMLAALMLFTFSVFAQKDTTKQFILIVRYNPKMTKPSPEALKTNIQHWNEFMGMLGQNGQIVNGYRPTPDGKVIMKDKTENNAYTAYGESISSIIIIKAADMGSAEAIAKKCPIMEFDGSVEVRPLMQMAN